MNTLYWFHQIHPADREQVGETALHLSRLQQQNCPVLSGFVLSAPCFWEFLESIQWSDPLFVDFPQTPLYLDPQNFQQLQAISRQIRQQILITPLSGALLQELRVALEVLNSAALRLELDLVSGDSPQGLFDLSICWTDLDAVALAVKQTWAELFRARSLFYWNHHRRLIRHLQPIVIVQPLPQTRASGSIHISENLWRIQTVWGLGSMVEQLRDAVRDAVEEIHIHPQTHEVQVQAAGEQTLLHQLRQSEHSQTHSLTMSASSASSASPANPVHLLNLSNLSDLSTPGIFPSLHSPIQAEVMPGSRIQSPILSQTELQSLIHLIHRIVLSTPGQWAIDWIQCWATPGFNPRSALEDEAETQLYLTRILPTALVEILADSHSSPQLGPEPLQLKGLGAAAGRAIARAHVVNSEADATQPFVSGSILVLPELTGTWLPLLKFAAGLVTEQGGMTGHGAILARELGIPAVLQVSQATQQIRFGSRILVDGDQGEVQLRPLLQVGSQAAPDQSPKATAASPPAVPLVALDQTEFPPINTHLMVNLSQISSLQSLQTLPIDGVGLLRSELMAFDILYDHLTLDRVQAKQTAIPIQLRPTLWDFSQWLQPGSQLEFIERMVRGLGQVIGGLQGRPVFYRALDLREFHQQVRPFWGETTIELEILSRHGATAADIPVTLLDLELAVLSRLYQLGEANVHLILPFIRSVEEFTIYRRRIAQAGLMTNSQFQLWIMAEVPSVLFLLPEYVEAGVQGIAIGTNDLTHLLLGTDRNQRSLTNPLAHTLNEIHPACLRAWQHLIEGARALNIPCSICGDAPVLYPNLIPSLIRWGIRSISVSPDAVNQTYQAIAEAEQALRIEPLRGDQASDKFRNQF